MPYRPRKVHQRPRRTLTAINVYELCTGHCFFYGEELPAEELVPAWQSVRQPLLNLYAQQCPGARPWAWWVCDAPEPRQVLAGQHDCPARDEHSARFPDRRLYYGRPGIYACPQCWDEQYESQPRYVRRLGLLLPVEETVIPQDLAACDAWARARYADDAVDSWEAGAALDGCETLLLALGGRL